MNCPPYHRFHRFLPALVGAALGLGLQGITVTPALAQAAASADDSAFLACSRFADRGQRIACLEDALEAVTAAEADAAAGTNAAADTDTGPAPAPEAAVVRSPETGERRPVAPTTPEDAAERETPLLERIRNFGRTGAGTDISVDASGQDRLHDSIVALTRRNNLWVVTLASGQVWRQTYPRSLLLKEGDSIEIYREGIGNGYRLATPRLNGFIRVERVE